MSSLVARWFAAVALCAVAQDGLYRTALYTDPAAGETPGTGAVEVYHPGEGKPGAGYFLKHEPGEVAEFHLFVPDGLAPGRTYPLWIVYHGGKDGASGKGLATQLSKLSTKDHPCFVLSPNMYTIDAFDELMQEGKHPIDRNRIAVMGFSSGGMGVRAALQGFMDDPVAHPFRCFVVASTMAPVPDGFVARDAAFVVMAGENETPEHMKHPALKQRRAGCRQSAWKSRARGADVRYIEVQGEGHAVTTPKHRAILQHLMRSLGAERFHHTAKKPRDEALPLLAAANAEDWTTLRSELDRLEGDTKLAHITRTARRKLGAALTTWFEARTKELAQLRAGSPPTAKTRAMAVHGHLRALVQALSAHAWAAKLEKAWKKVTAGPRI
jgi:poly(3-hydroxybutyrate) depolymerase